jgi:arsenate reductase (glutaredoxin)
MQALISVNPASIVTITIYHNPSCGTSRNVLAMIRAAGDEPNVIEYLSAPPDRSTLTNLISQMQMSARDLLRLKGTPFADSGLATAGLDDAQLIDRMVADPILINRPIVVSSKGARLCRPSDLVVPLLENLPRVDILKSDGSPVLRETPLAHDVAELASALEAEGLPTDDLIDAGRRFFSYDTLSDARVGFGGFEIFGREALIRSVVTLPHTRGHGVGGSLLGLLLRRAFDYGARRAWILTTNAAPYFERKGFKLVDRSQAPQEILFTRQFSALCPASASLLLRSIEL